MAGAFSLIYTLERVDSEGNMVAINVSVEYDYEGGCDVVMPSFNDPGSPAEAGEVTITAVWKQSTGADLESIKDTGALEWAPSVKLGGDFVLTDKEYEQIESYIQETHNPADYIDDDLFYHDYD